MNESQENQVELSSDLDGSTNAISVSDSDTPTITPTFTTYPLDTDRDDDNSARSLFDADAIFSFATKGILDAVLQPIVFINPQLLKNDGNLRFGAEAEPVTTASDRHQSNSILKRVKENRHRHSVFQQSLPGSQYRSRSPSRVSSRAASRLGGSNTASFSIHSTALAMRMTKLALGSAGENPFHITPWHETSSQAPSSHRSNSLDREAQSSSHINEKWGYSSLVYSARRSLAGIAKIPIDYTELKRRDEIDQDINLRNAKERLANDLRRKSHFKLKLRSLADPTISVEKEEEIASLAAQVERNGKSRLSTRLTTPMIPIRSLSPTPITISTHPRGNIPSIVPPQLTEETITFRKEDYEGLKSDVLILEKNGELMVGENCFVVAKKPRQEIQLDLFQKSTIEPRIHLLTPPNPIEQTMPINGSAPNTGFTLQVAEKERLPTRNLLTRASSPHHSPDRQSTKAEVIQTATFEGKLGSFQSYPKIELDPTKTPLAKGVVLKATNVQPSQQQQQHKQHSNNEGGESLPRQVVPKLNENPIQILEDASNQALETHIHTMLQKGERHKFQDRTKNPHDAMKNLSNAAATTSEKISSPHPRAQQIESGKSILPKHVHQGEKHLQNLRVRTPACRDRISHKMSGTLFSDDPIVEGDESDATFVNTDFSLREKHQSSNLPKVNYMREFPSPPNGMIKLVAPISSVNGLPSSSATSSYPFATLPIVIKGKR